jgi:GntR family transcriptional regulator, carbon starvation induced regulator
MQPSEPNDETDARIAAERIVSDIRTGVLAPGFKLRVAELRTRYGIGASPLREALSLVTSLGYATTESHRGYRVAEVSVADLADITSAREVIETGMLRASMLAHSDEWTVGIVSARERLRLLAGKAGPGSLGRSELMRAAHKQLHIALVAGCSSRRLAEMQSLLFDQAGRYREIMVGQIHSPQDFFDVHDLLVQTILSGDIDKACEELRQHLRRTMQDVYCGTSPDGASPDQDAISSHGRAEQPATSS